MVVMTQKTMQLIPFENFVFSVCENNIVCDKDILTKPSEIERRVIATYDTPERAKGVLLEMLDEYAKYFSLKNIHGVQGVYDFPKRYIMPAK